MNELELRFPNEKDKDAVEEYLKEHYEKKEYTLNGMGGAERINNFDQWLQKIKNDLSKETVGKGRVPSTLYLAIRKLDQKIIGTIQIRHELNQQLLDRGGNIGYGVRPSERNNGYAKEMLKLALEKCKKMKIEKVLISCDKDNVGSAKTIITNQGKLEDEREIDGIMIQRYWIDL